MTESDDTLLKNLLSEIEQLGIVELRKYFKDLYGFETRNRNRGHSDCKRYGENESDQNQQGEWKLQ